MIKTFERLCIVVAAALAVGCTSTRISDSIDGVGKAAVRARTEHKYHVEKMLRKGVSCDGALPEGNSCASLTEIDRLERMAPEIFDRAGIPCSVVVETEREKGSSVLGGVWRLLCGCTLCVLPSKRSEAYVRTYRVRIANSSREKSFVIRRRYETWTSSIGLNYLMPFSRNARTAYCWDDETSVQRSGLAEADGIASELRKIEIEQVDGKKRGPRIGD